MKIRLSALEKRQRGPVAEEADVGEEDADEEQETDEEEETEEEEEENAIAADPDWLPPLDDDSPPQEK